MFAFLVVLIASPVLAQQAPPAGPDVPAVPDAPSADADVIDPDAEDPIARNGEILVIASRLMGQVEAAQPPIVTLDEADISAYGTSSLAELLTAVAPQTGSGRGRGGGFPVILINGQRIGNFREMANFPPEAIRRMEVLPEEVALRYGYSANQRVVNFILKDNFASKMVRGEYNGSTHGGLGESELQATLQRITGAKRLNLNLYTNNTSLLTESERPVIPALAVAPIVAGDPGPAQFRTLLPDTRDIGLSGTWSTGFGSRGMDGSLSLNASLSQNDSRTLSGLDSFVLTAPGGAVRLRTLGDPLARVSRTQTIEGGGGFNRKLGNWNLSLTLDAGHAVTNSTIDRRADVSGLVAAAAAGDLALDAPLPAVANAGADRAHYVSDRASTLLTFSGSPLRLPAGDVGATLKAGFAYTGIVSSDTRQSGAETRLRRGDASAGLNLSLPIASRKEHALEGIGDLTLNVSAGLDHLSDFGTLTDWSAGLTWGPTEKLSLQASYIVNQAAPGLSDLGGPQIQSLNEIVFDFARGETRQVTLTSGGNLLLRRETQRDIKLSANWQLPFIKNSSLIAEYFRNRSSDVTAAFPLLTPAIEAAFPGRAVRDASGRLIAIDRRPVTFSETSGSRLRLGINIGGQFGKAPAGGESAPFGSFGRPGGGQRARGAGGRGGVGVGARGLGGRGGFGGPGGGPPGAGRGRWNLAIYHTVRFDEGVIVAPGGPVLDLLGGDALSGGGVARHAVEFEGGGFYRGFGLRLNGNWNAPTHLRASGAPGTSDLRFGSVFKVNVRMFIELGAQKRLTDISPFFKGMRLNLRVDNLFDLRSKVTDATGATPLSYQADYLDPRGRMIGIDLRKTF
ncbi:MAG: TonB-dependent receptor [Novosphingobium sp.]